MRRNKDLNVLVGCGYYDLATPFFGAENALSQDGVVHERIDFRYYDVGHMIFLHEPSRVRFTNDVREFIRSGHAGDTAPAGAGAAPRVAREVGSRGGPVRASSIER
jgi:hypothetical protein